MPGFSQIVAQLKKEEHRLAAQLANIRTAIASPTHNNSGRGGRSTAAVNAGGSGPRRRRRKMSAASLTF